MLFLLKKFKLANDVEGSEWRQNNVSYMSFVLLLSIVHFHFRRLIDARFITHFTSGHCSFSFQVDDRRTVDNSDDDFAPEKQVEKQVARKRKVTKSPKRIGRLSPSKYAYKRFLSVSKSKAKRKLQTSTPTPNRKKWWKLFHVSAVGMFPFYGLVALETVIEFVVVGNVQLIDKPFIIGCCVSKPT